MQMQTRKNIQVGTSLLQVDPSPLDTVARHILPGGLSTSNKLLICNKKRIYKKKKICGTPENLYCPASIFFIIFFFKTNYNIFTLETGI